MHRWLLKHLYEYYLPLPLLEKKKKEEKKKEEAAAAAVAAAAAAAAEPSGSVYLAQAAG